MRILYGVSGDGFGHSSRALIVGKYLEKKGHNLIIVTYGRAYKVLKGKFDIFKVKGMEMIFKKNILKKRETIKYSFKRFSDNILHAKKFHRFMKKFRPDICISDMEPIVPILSFWYKLPLISIDNQHRLTNLEFSIPENYKKDFLIAKEVVKIFVRNADFFIVVSFTGGKIKKKNTFLVPPMVREEVKKLKPRYMNKILVYLTRKNRDILGVLKKINEKFVVYGYEITKREGNLRYKKTSSFLKDLKNCKAIIATSGFTLISEAIYLKKPYLAVPLKGQFEQTLNSLFLKRAGFGDYTEDLTKKDVIDFLSNIENYKKNLEKHNPNYNKIFAVLDKILTRMEKR